MTIAVIIPTYNRLELTQNCLNSITRHDPINEIIIVDNGSIDGTEKLATIANPHNLGFAAACNQGARHATADRLIFLNNDTIVTAGWLDALLEAVRAAAALVRAQTRTRTLTRTLALAIAL
jgi:GT2 family glycosyltransferase